VNNRGLTCAPPLALANNYIKESPQATKVSEGLARLDADRAEIATQSSGSRREWTRRSRGQDSNRRSLSRKRVGLFGGTGSAGEAKRTISKSGAILGGPRVRFPVPPAGSLPLGSEAARGAGLFSVPQAVQRPQSGASAATLKTLYRFGVQSGGGTTFELTPNCNEWHQALPAGDDGRRGIRHKQVDRFAEPGRGLVLEGSGFHPVVSQRKTAKVRSKWLISRSGQFARRRFL
jgi:hypothetical protein